MRKLSAVILMSLSGVVLGADNVEVEGLKRELRELRELRERTEQLERRLEAIGSSSVTNAPAVTGEHDHTHDHDHDHDHGTHEHDHARDQTTGSHLHFGAKSGNLLDISLNVFGVAGVSTERDVENLQLGGHDPHQRGFTLQQAELALEGHLEPHLRGQLNTLMFITPDGSTEVELEEAFLETLTLPGRLQLKAGHFLSEFGRHNPTHLHTWDFVDSPLVNARLLGPDGLRSPGARLSWEMPTPFRSELLLAVQNSGGETAQGFRGSNHAHGAEEGEEVPFAFRHGENDRGVRNPGDLLLVPRYRVSFEPTEHQSVSFGSSAAFGPNISGGAAAGDTDTEVYGVDLTWKWSAAEGRHGFPFVAFQAEAMLRKYEAGAFDWDEDGDGAVSPGEVADAGTGLPAVLDGESLTDYGIYAQAVYGFHDGWVAGLRADWMGGDEAEYERRALTIDSEPLGRDPRRAERWRISPNITWHPTEFSKVRLQYNYDRRKDIPEKDEDHSVWLQFEFTLGAHPPH